MKFLCEAVQKLQSEQTDTQTHRWTDTRTDRHMDTQTDRHDRKHYLPAFTGGNNIGDNHTKCIDEILSSLTPKQFINSLLPKQELSWLAFLGSRLPTKARNLVLDLKFGIH